MTEISLTTRQVTSVIASGIITEPTSEEIQMMSSPRTYRLCFALALLLCGLSLVVAGPTVAQEEVAPVEDVISVTALKGEPLSLLETPIAVTAISGEELDDRGVDTLIDFLQEAPGAAVNENFNGFLQIEIRGVSSDLGDPLIGFYIDETPYSFLQSPAYPNVGTFDLERVEVLRGPQGTLYGAGAAGGVIRLLTRQPQLDGFSVHGDIGLSSFDGGETSAFGNLALNAPLGDKAAVRLTGSFKDRGGYIAFPARGEDDGNDGQDTVWRGKLLFEPSDSTSITLSATLNEVDADSQNTSDRGWVSNKLVPEPGNTTNDFFSGVVSWTGNRFSLLSSTNWVESEFRNTLEFFGGPIITATLPESFTQEIRLSSTTGGDWNWTAGAYYTDLDQLGAQDLSAIFGPGFILSSIDTSESLALFGQLSRSFAGGRAQATLGARYWEEDKTSDDPATAGGREEKTYDDISPRFSLVFYPNPDNTFYFNVAKGFRSGQPPAPGLSGLAALFGVPVPPGAVEETLWAYEVGHKSQRAGGKVLLEATAYYNDWQNLIASAPIVQGVFSSVVNVGAAEMPGIELAIKVRPNDTVSFGFSGNWNDAKYSENAEVLALDPTTGMAVPVLVFADGDRIDLVPQKTLNANVEVQRYFGALRGFATLRAAYTDERVLDRGGVDEFSDEVTRLDLRLGVDAERWALHLFADNLNNEDGITATGFAPDAGWAYAPRAVGLNFRFRP